MKSLQLLLTIILPRNLLAANGFLELFKTKADALATVSKSLTSSTNDVNLTVSHQNLPEFGKEKNIYSKQDRFQVHKNQELIKQAKIVQGSGLANDTQTPAILKAAFAPGPTDYYDYKKEIWYNFRYKNINLVASGLVHSDDRSPPHCELYQPDVQWTKRDFSNICMKLRKSLPDVRTLCQTIDMDRNGGTCKNYQAIMSFENSGKPDVWLNRNTFDYNASNDPKQDCHLYTYHEYSTVVYACKNPVLVSSKPTQYNTQESAAQLSHGLTADLLSHIASGGSLQSRSESKVQDLAFSKHSLVAQNSVDMLRMMLTHTGRKGLVERVLNHGCWCPYIRDPFAGFSGRPMDEFDEMCRDHRECLKCASYPPNNCAKSKLDTSNYTITYDNEDGTWSCESENNPCIRAKCECDLDFALNINDQITVTGEYASKQSLREVQAENSLSECPKAQANIQAGIELLPGEVYSPRGPAQLGIPVKSATLVVSDDDEEHSQVRNNNKMKTGTDIYRNGGRGGRRVTGKSKTRVQHMCCGTAPNWKIYNKDTHQCTRDGYVLFNGGSELFE